MYFPFYKLKNIISKLIIKCSPNKDKNIIIKLYEQNISLDSLLLDYCTNCDQLILNKFNIYHCNKCGTCHIKNKLYCIECNNCYHPLDDNDLIKHRKICNKHILI